jgi:hypothetical protein
LRALISLDSEVSNPSAERLEPVERLGGFWWSAEKP